VRFRASRAHGSTAGSQNRCFRLGGMALLRFAEPEWHAGWAEWGTELTQRETKPREGQSLPSLEQSPA
ncbi:MAG: hypothetical protein LBP74_01480, partial [Treponema sp.]|nr:hypothetical protein [Treponema sp.]